jgi:hypothetical protein
MANATKIQGGPMAPGDERGERCAERPERDGRTPLEPSEAPLQRHRQDQEEDDLRADEKTMAPGALEQQHGRERQDHVGGRDGG